MKRIDTSIVRGARGFGIWVSKGPSVADPVGIYKYIIGGYFWKWTFSVGF